jgi:hypothetical protein
MPFFIQQPPQGEIPKTLIETEYHSQESKNIDEEALKLDMDYIHQVNLKANFISLKQAWINETFFLSSVLDIIENNNFKRILKLGKDAIPLIIDEIEKKPSSLVWALNIITGATIDINQRLTLTQACKMWVKLYRSGKVQF